MVTCFDGTKVNLTDHLNHGHVTIMCHSCDGHVLVMIFSAAPSLMSECNAMITIWESLR